MLSASVCLVITAIPAPLFQHRILLFDLSFPSRLLQYMGANTSNCSKMSLLCQAGSSPDQSSICNNRSLLADDRLRQSPGRLSGLFSLASPPLLLVDSRGGLGEPGMARRAFKPPSWLVDRLDKHGRQKVEKKNNAKHKLPGKYVF